MSVVYIKWLINLFKWTKRLKIRDKTKLAISFCIIIFVPVVLTSIVLVGFNKIQLKAINKTYGMEDAGMSASLLTRCSF